MEPVIPRGCMVLLIWCLFCNLLLTTRISGYNSGAQTDSCVDLGVTHTVGNQLPILPQSDESPFRITVLDSSNRYRLNREVSVVIEGDVGRLFNGFILQARREGSTVPVGRWTTIPANTKTLTCDAIDDTVTHNISLPPVSRLEMKWTPTQDYGSVRFWASITENFSTFWTNQSSQPITYDSRAVVFFTESGGIANEGDGITMVEICVNRAISQVEVSLSVTTETASEADIRGYPQTIVIPVVVPFLCSSFSVTLEDDEMGEPDETLLINIASVTGNVAIDDRNGAFRLTITDNDGGGDGIISVIFTSEVVTATESREAINFDVCLSRISTVDTSIFFEIVSLDNPAPAAEDLTYSSPLSIRAGSRCGNLLVGIVDDNVVEDTESFIIRLLSSTPPLNIPATPKVLILSDGNGDISVNFSSEVVNAGEDDGSVLFKVCLSQVVTFNVSIDFEISRIFASESVLEDLTFFSPVSILVGSDCGTLEIGLVNDNIVEGREDFLISLVSSRPPLILPPRAAVLRLDDSAVLPPRENNITFTTNALSVSEDAGTAQVEVCASQTEQGNITIAFTIQRSPLSGVPVSEDLTAASPVVIPAGNLCNSITITLIQDMLLEDDENYVITLTAAHPIGTLVTTSLSLTLTDSQLGVCQSFPCFNGGSCVLTNNDDGFVCLCVYGYTGALCSEEEIFLPVSISPLMLTLQEEAENGTLSVCFTGVQNFSNVNFAVTFDTASSNDVIADFPLEMFSVQLNESFPCTSLEISAIKDGITEGEETLSISIVAASSSSSMRLDERVTTTIVTILDEDPPCLRLAPCQNGGQCRNENDGSFTCTCTSDWFGPTCEIANPCLAGPCQNGGECVATEINGEVIQTCTCTDRWTDENCATAILCSPDPCQNGASCAPLQQGADYECLGCPSTHIGKNCNIFLPCSSTPCQNQGSCTNIGETDFQCRCTALFVGKECQFPNPCMGNPSECVNGNCVPNDDGTLFCQCHAGFFGRVCDIPEICAANPCRNGGTCEAQAPSEIVPYICTCTSGFRGDNCELVDLCDQNLCSNGGTCSNIGNSYTCACPEGFRGTQCESRLVTVNRCDLVSPCLNGGTCVREDESCICTAEWEGPSCERRTSEPSTCPPEVAALCQNGAQCVFNSNNMQHTCLCTGGFIGDMCDVPVSQPVDLCNPNPCGPDGTCFVTSRDGGAYICTCLLSFLGGEHCDVCLTNHCQNGGTCRNINGDPGCVCPTGVSGDNCEIVEECRNMACNNGGVCLLRGSQAICECQDGFIGNNCDNIDPCFGVNCRNGGACQSDQGSCVCPANFAGDNCEVELSQQNSSASAVYISWILLFVIPLNLLIPS